MGSFHKNCRFWLWRNPKPNCFHRLCSGPLLLVCALISTMATSAPVNALTPEEQAVLVPIQDLFDGIAKRSNDGNLDHGGTDIINLVFVDGKWMIAGVLDNSRRSDEPVKPLTFGK
jgi:hypothetical protein